MEISQNTKRTTVRPSNSIPGCISQNNNNNNKTQNTNSKRYMFPNVHSSIMYNH